MTESELKSIIAANIVHYRIEAGMTQLQLAEYLNYSDKSISKWENADGLPDVYVLYRMAELFEIELSDLTRQKRRKRPMAEKKQKALIMAISAALVGLIAAVVFGFGYFFTSDVRFTLAFAYILPVSGIIALVLASVWRWRIVSGVSTSAIIWGIVLVLAATIQSFTGGNVENLWVFVIIAASVQILAVLWFFFRGALLKAKSALMHTFEKTFDKSRVRRNKKKSADGQDGQDGEADQKQDNA